MKMKPKVPYGDVLTAAVKLEIASLRVDLKRMRAMGTDHGPERGVWDRRVADFTHRHVGALFSPAGEAYIKALRKVGL
jgi:hypothetical protein